MDAMYAADHAPQIAAIFALHAGTTQTFIIVGLGMDGSRQKVANAQFAGSNGINKGMELIWLR